MAHSISPSRGDQTLRLKSECMGVCSYEMSPITVRKFKISSLFAVVFVLSPATVYGDAGIPMLPFAYPVILVFLLPVIVIEAAYIRLRLHTEWKNTFAAATKANLITMLLGFPLAWLVFFLLEMAFWLTLTFSGIESHIHLTLDSRFADFLTVVMSAAWMGPVQEKWAVPVAYVVLLIPSFVFSGYVESRLLERRWLKYEGRSAKIVWEANLLSYIFLAAAGCFALVEAIGRS